MSNIGFIGLGTMGGPIARRLKVSTKDNERIAIADLMARFAHAIDRCERVAHTLANLAVKHG